MVGEGRTTGRRSRRLFLALAGVAATFAIFAASASALTLTAHTNRDGKCRLHTTASRTGAQIKYGIKVNDCSTRFGVRYVISQGALYDQTEGLVVEGGFLGRKKGDVPYTNRRGVGGTDPTHAYQTKIDVSIVLKTRRKRSTRHPERWLDPGKRCRVTTTAHNADT